MERLKTIEELRTALNDLRSFGYALKTNFAEFENFISQEKFPELELTDSLNRTFYDWIRGANKCFKLYDELFDNERPASFLALEELLNAEEKRVREANFFGQAEKFLQLTTNNVSLRKILREHKTKLKKLLAKKRQNAKWREAVEPYSKFINAAEEKDFGRKFSAGKELSEFFGDEFIGRGLFGSELIMTLSEIGEETPVTLPTKEKSVNPPRMKESVELVPDKSEPAQVESEIIRLVKSTGALLKESDFDEWTKIFTIEKNERNKEFSASRFKRDFKNSDILKPVLRYVSSQGMLWKPEFAPSKMPPNIVDNIAQLLVNRGYIQKYTFKGYDTFYGLTDSFADFLETESGKKFILNAKHGEKMDFDNPPFITDSAIVALTRIIYFELYDIVTAQRNFFHGADFYPYSFRAEFIGRGSLDLFIGCFWYNFDDCDKFIKRLTNSLHKNKKYTRVFIVGITLKQAAQMFEVLEKVLGDDFPKDAKHYIFAFEHEGFYRRETLERISIGDIWKKINPEPNDNPPQKKSDDEKELSEESVFEIQKAEPLHIDAEVRDKILRDVKDLLVDEKFYCATAYLKAQTLKLAETEPLYRQLAFALDDPFLNEGYSANAISILASRDDDTFNESLITAAALRAFFYNDFGVDYGVPALHALLTSFVLVKSNAPLAELISDLRNFKTAMRKGVDFYADYRTKDKALAEKNLARIIAAAEEYYMRFFEGRLTDKANNETFIRLKQNIFSRNGDLAQIFSAIKEKTEVQSTYTLDIVKEFLAEIFLKKDAGFNAVNLDKDKLEQFVAEQWDAVCDKKNPGKLTGELKNNIKKTLERAVEIMCAWVQCAEIFSASGEDNGSIEYKKIRSRLINNITVTRKNFKSNFGAGGNVIDKTLVELSARLEGNFNPLERKYFYAQFLCSDKIILDENYLPKLDLNISDGTRENIPEQILKHAALKLPTFEERIEQIFESGGDDFGSAQLIDDYLKFLNGESFVETKDYDLKKCVSSAAKDAPRCRESFIGGLELAQSYGQFETMPEGSKEKILQLAENCYEYAEQSKNFGVFFRVKQYWENVIEENAAEHAQNLENELQTAVESFKHIVQNFDAVELDDTVSEISKIIFSRNFTVARSLIFKLSEGELYKKFDDVEDTELVRFISDHDDCRSKVCDSSYSLENLIGKKIFPHDKVSRAQLNLVKNWITNPVGEDKIKTLLELLGFEVKTVQKISSSANTINFNVKIFSSVQTKYSHPIAVFGSDAESDGFRVSCIFGKYDEKDLISKFKELGTSKNTLVLLDYALDKGTRRLLAREIKLDKALTEVVFAVVDRVTVMYLVKNCAKQIGTKRINDTLMALIMPFARYQPYVSSPRVPLPPEMFIGRENEINEVMNQSGVNIVCGGRQLGKSALLKMACRKIDAHNDQRAIYLEIADKEYGEAALLISRELSDKNFFSESFETDDWEKLARAIRNRLSSSTPTKISYFLLMLDEADKFIESCAENNYNPIVALAKIQQEYYNGSRFKFVIAGLRNIIRFEREKTFGNNSILPTLKSLTIKPFNVEDARKLLEVPLRYLGLYFPDNQKDSLILTILETANYFPSLIQLYCEKLIKALFEPSYAGYDANTPIYRISEEHIKKVLADRDFTKDIKTKIEITLRLGEDKYYFVIANLLACLYYRQNDLNGYSPRDILNAAKSFELIKEPFLPNSEEKIGSLMEELCELNILRKTGSAKYLFSRQRILRIVGSLNEVEETLLKLMSEAENG